LKLPPFGASRGDLRRRLHALKRRRLRGRFFRLVPSFHADAISETGPSFANGGRFNPRGEFGALYLSEVPEISWKETLKKYGDRAQDVPAQSIGVFELDVQKGLDLTDEKVLKALGVTLEDITQPADHYLTQMIAAAWSLGIEAIKFPSSIDPRYFNVAVFVDHLSGASTVKCLKVSRYRPSTPD
jgi:RES domain-containing protein